MANNRHGSYDHNCDEACEIWTDPVAAAPDCQMPKLHDQPCQQCGPIHHNAVSREADVAAALRECEEACPCRDDMLLWECNPGSVVYCEHHDNGGTPDVPCEWPGHAAIRRLESAARLTGRLEQAEKMHLACCHCGNMCPVCGCWNTHRDDECRGAFLWQTDPACRTERDRLRKEAGNG